jgi:hypothetical protein
MTILLTLAHLAFAVGLTCLAVLAWGLIESAGRTCSYARQRNGQGSD